MSSVRFGSVAAFEVGRARSLDSLPSYPSSKGSRERKGIDWNVLSLSIQLNAERREGRSVFVLSLPLPLGGQKGRRKGSMNELGTD